MFGKSTQPHHENKLAVQKQFSDVEEQEVHSKTLFLPERLGRADSSDGPSSFLDLSHSIVQHSGGFRKFTIVIHANTDAAHEVRSDADDSNQDSAPKKHIRGKVGSSRLRKALEHPSPASTAKQNDDDDGSSAPRSRGLFSPRSKLAKSSPLSRAKRSSLLSEPGDL